MPAVQPLLAARLANQRLAAPMRGAVELVRAMGAMQAQEYWGGLWAIGLRTGGSEAAIEQELAAGRILRTHPMRGTHHVVARDDIRWLIDLMGPLMIPRNERRNRELDLDEKTLSRALKALDRELTGGNHLTRTQTADVLRRAKIAPDGQRLAHVIYRGELEGLLCSGVRQGKQITIALVAERAPTAKPRSREDSLRELATRYFTTRGPATRADFTWWCQLPAVDVRAAMELAKLDTDGTYYTKGRIPRAKGPRAYLLPPYDEYTVAYRDRSLIGTPPTKARTFGEMALLAPMIVLDGRIVGTWRRDRNRVISKYWTKLAREDTAAVTEAILRYGAFTEG